MAPRATSTPKMMIKPSSGRSPLSVKLAIRKIDVPRRRKFIKVAPEIKEEARVLVFLRTFLPREA